MDDTKAQTVDEFINGVKNERKKRLRGLKLDIAFFDMMLAKEEYNEDKLRDELEVENKKIEKDKEGKILKDESDREKVGELNTKINKITQMKQQQAQFVDVRADMVKYIAYLDAPSEELKKTLE